MCAFFFSEFQRAVDSQTHPLLWEMAQCWMGMSISLAPMLPLTTRFICKTLGKISEIARGSFGENETFFFERLVKMKLKSHKGMIQFIR